MRILTHMMLGMAMLCMLCVTSVQAAQQKEKVLLDTDMGMLTIKGKELHISRLSLELGEADLEGKVDSISYSDKGHKKKQEGSLITRLFR